MDSKAMLLDCTLRDGGYINDWKWGEKVTKAIIKKLVKARIDVIEVGFLRNIDTYDKNICIGNRIEELDALLPEKANGVRFSAMAMCSNYSINKLSDRDKTRIDIIRVTAHDYDIKEGLKFAKEVQNRGYLVSINPINIKGYSDDGILRILEAVEKVHPYQFSIVDTFGSMKRRDLDRIVSLVDNNLSEDIRVGLHLHENMALSFSLAQRFIDSHLERPIMVDGSLLGMGRVPGNLPIELIADYINENVEKKYGIDYLMDAIHDYIEPLKEKYDWGYSPTYFLSAKYNLHRNYAEYFLEKGDLTHRDINHILARLDRGKANVFDMKYADELYLEYKNNEIEDIETREYLRERFFGKKILILAPGKSLVAEKIVIDKYLEANEALVISVNFISEVTDSYAFFSNARRLEQATFRTACQVIGTSNLECDKLDYVVDHNKISGGFEQGCNSLILLLNLLHQVGVKKVTIAGADGYKYDDENYFDPTIKESIKHDNTFNQAVGKALNAIPIEISFLTKSVYTAFYKR